MDAPRNAPTARGNAPRAGRSVGGRHHALVLRQCACCRTCRSSLRAGSIHALLGENGAGKSTLINVLSGGLKPDSGTIVVDGETHDPSDPGARAGLGIAVVHQELSASPRISRSPRILASAGFRGAPASSITPRLAREASAIFADLEADFPLDAPAARLAARRAAARRDRQGALSQAAHAHPGRADLLARRGRGRAVQARA